MRRKQAVSFRVKKQKENWETTELKWQAVDAWPELVGFFIGDDGVFEDGDAEGAVVFDEGLGTVFEGDELAADGGKRVVDAAGSVATCVAADAMKDGVRCADEMDEENDAEDVGDVVGLSKVPRQAVENDDVAVGGAMIAEEGEQDLAGDVELFVFQECACVEKLADDVTLVGREVGGLTGGGEAELVAKVKVRAMLVPETVTFEGHAERCLAGAGGADDENGVVNSNRLTKRGGRERKNVWEG